MRFRELPFQILDAIPERLRLGVASIRIAARRARPRRSGHEAQVSPCSPPAVPAPLIHLAGTSCMASV